MATPSPGTAARPDEASRTLDRGFWLVAILGGICIVLVVVSMAASILSPQTGAGTGAIASASPDASGPIDVAAYLTDPAPAPPLALIDQDAAAFDLASLRGGPVLVFFGYTHCPDVCPATIGTIGEAMTAVGGGVRAVFVTVDPERDTPTWLTEYVRYLPAGFMALTGSDTEIARAADDWGVRYARVETGVADAYAMSHTADVFLVDGSGSLRARFPFGTGAGPMAGVIRAVLASGSATPVPTASGSTHSASPSPDATAPVSPAELGVEVVSSSIWAGSRTPIILTLSLNGVRLDDPSLVPKIQLASVAGEPFGAVVTASAVQPPGVAKVSYVAMVPIDEPGAWRIVVSATSGGRPLLGSAVITAKDPGGTPAIGDPAPAVHTPTLADAGGIARAVTTDPAPDLRLSERSTTDALADRTPFVLVVDSVRFKVSPACGRAVVMARYFLDRWPTVDFIHLEPYRYAVVTDTAVLEGSLGSPILTEPTAAWGVGVAPWGPLSMPWMFVVDGDGIVRAKYQGVIGSDDVDVIVALIEAGG